VVRRRCSPQFVHPNLLELILSRLLPDERTEATVIVGRERNKAERLQYMVDGTQHLCPSQHGAASGQEHQLDLRSLDDWLRDCKQAPSERNYLEVSPKALSIWQPKHSRSLAFKMSARDAPRRPGLGEATHNVQSVCSLRGY